VLNTSTKEAHMSTHTTIGIPTRQRRSRYWLAAAMLAAAIVGAALALTVNALTDDATSTAVVASVAPTGSAARDAKRVPSLMTLTPARLAAGALGTSYALPTHEQGPTMASVLAAMDPKTRAYTKKIMALTFNQLAAGAAGSP
jgi:hypothetical protein